MSQGTKPAFELRLSRVIDAPRERVWKAWAQPEQMKKWFAPKPYQLLIDKMDFRAGGSFAMTMQGPQGETHDFGGVYQAVEPPSRLVWIGQFPGEPEGSMRTEVTFTEEGGKTRVEAHQTFAVLGPISTEATKGARQGWTMTLDQLAAVVEGTR